MKTVKALFTIVLLALMTTLSFSKDSKKTDEDYSRIAKRFVHILHEQWGIEKEKVSGESHFLRDFGADALDIMELVMALEEDFDIEIDEAEWEKATTVNSAVELIIDKQGRRYYRHY